MAILLALLATVVTIPLDSETGMDFVSCGAYVTGEVTWSNPSAYAVVRIFDEDNYLVDAIQLYYSGEQYECYLGNYAESSDSHWWTVECSLIIPGSLFLPLPQSCVVTFPDDFTFTMPQKVWLAVCDFSW